MKTENTCPFPSKQWLYVQGYMIAEAARMLGVPSYRLNQYLEGKRKDADLEEKVLQLPRRSFAGSERARMNRINEEELLAIARNVQSVASDMLEEYETCVYPKGAMNEPAPFHMLKGVSEFLLWQLESMVGILKDMTPNNLEALQLVEKIREQLQACEILMAEYRKLVDANQR